jgi:hypothetical protein
VKLCRPANPEARPSFLTQLVDNRAQCSTASTTTPPRQCFIATRAWYFIASFSGRLESGSLLRHWLRTLKANLSRELPSGKLSSLVKPDSLLQNCVFDHARGVTNGHLDFRHGLLGGLRRRPLGVVQTLQLGFIFNFAPIALHRVLEMDIAQDTVLCDERRSLKGVARTDILAV